MKQLVFVDHAPFAGGAQLVLAQHIAHLDKTQFKVSVICSDAVPLLVERYQHAGATVQVMNFPRLKGGDWHLPLRLLQATLTLRRLLRQLQPDVAICNTERSAYLLSLAGWGLSFPIIWWVRDRLYNRWLLKTLGRRAAAIICVSKAIQDHYGLAHDRRAKVIYVASDLIDHLGEVTQNQIAAERAKWQLGEDDVVVGYMGRLVEEKGAADLVQAVGELSQRYPQLKLLIVGSGNGQAHSVEDQLHQLVTERRWQDHIKFAGYQTNEALYYQLFDVLVLSTRDFEAFATTVVQAMMAGKPVIGTDAGGTRELVVNDQTGWLIPPNNPDAIKTALIDLLEHPDKAKRLAEAGRARVLQYHQESYVTAELANLYLSL